MADTLVLYVGGAIVLVMFGCVLHELILLLRRGDTLEAYLPEDVKQRMSARTRRVERLRIICMIVAFGAVFLVGVLALFDAPLWLISVVMVIAASSAAAYLLASVIGGFVEGMFDVKDGVKRLAKSDRTDDAGM